ncbi:MAG: hypothetical protein KDA71_14120, partial [Planctomycetales bacterium]|nr:hypothetical protein [Planctomycetales bacterium]
MNGKQDASERGFADVEVFLRDPNTGAIVASTLSNANGFYYFDSRDVAISERARYDMTVDMGQFALSGFTYTLSNAASVADTVDSDGVPDSRYVNTVSIRNILTPSYTLFGINATTYDFGFIENVTSVCFLLYDDTNRDGNRNAGEAALSLVNGNLLDANSFALHGSDTSNASGLFTFTQVPTTTDMLMVLPSGQTRLNGKQPNTLREPSFTIDPNGEFVFTFTSLDARQVQQARNCYDLPIVPEFVIGDFVWLDEDKNGVQDSGEPGLENVRVVLRDASTNDIVASTRTDADGLYEFRSASLALLADTLYDITITVADSASLRDLVLTTYDSAQADPDTNSDAKYTDRSRVAIIRDARTPNYGEQEMTFDFGFVENFTEQCVVFFRDTNNNCARNSGENGVGPIDVVLREAGRSRVVDTARSASSGLVTLLELDPSVQFDLSVDYAQSVLRSLQISADCGVSVPDGKAFFSNVIGTSSNNNINSMLIEFESLSATDPIPPCIFVPLVERFYIGDFVWVDANVNGVQDAGEAALSGVDVQIRRPSSNTIVANTTTDANGFYLFDSLVHGLQVSTAYVVTIDMARNPQLQTMQLTTAHAGSNNALDSDGVLSVSGRPSSASIVMNSFGTTNVDDADFGFVQRVEIGDLIWIDRDGDGQQDAFGEPGLSNVAVQLLSANGAALMATTTTNANGRYLFSAFNGLRAGEAYLIRVATNQNALRDPITSEALYPTVALAGNDRAIDSNGVMRGVQAGQPFVEARITSAPAAGGADNSIDFGFHPNACIGDFVWYDMNGNGIQDDGGASSGVGAINVALNDELGTELARTVTTAQGAYLFCTSDAGLQTGQSYVITVSLSQSALSGYITTGSLVGFNAGLDSNGIFLSGLGVSSSAVFGPLPGVSEVRVDFGFKPDLRVSGLVWSDGDHNGLNQFADDVPLSGVRVSLRNPATGVVSGTTTTNSSGIWQFTSSTHSLTPGDYVLCVEQQSSLNGFDLSAQHVLGNPAPIDSDLQKPTASDLATFQAMCKAFGTVTLTAGAPAAAGVADVGLVRSVQVGNRVWLDQNGNGIQDASELGLRNIRVRLYAQDGSTLLDVRLTNSAGEFVFGDSTAAGAATLAPSTSYVLCVDERDVENSIVASTLVLTAPLQGANVNADSNGVQDGGGGQARACAVMRTPAAPAVGSPSTVLQDLSIDFGYKPRPTPVPTTLPTREPSNLPTRSPTKSPTRPPSEQPTPFPTNAPTLPPVPLPLLLNITTRLWNDVNGDGLFVQNTDVGIAGMIVDLYALPVDGVSAPTLVASRASDSAGFVSFTHADGLVSGIAYTMLVREQEHVARNLYPTYYLEGNNLTSCVDSNGQGRAWPPRVAADQQRAVQAVDFVVGPSQWQSRCLDFGFFDCLFRDPGGTAVGASPFAQIQFTGFAQDDFERAVDARGTWFYYQDNPALPIQPDVGIPAFLGSGFVSGFDVRGFYIGYSAMLDVLYVGYDCFGICGDADGDGDPGQTTLLSEGTDHPNLGGSETFTLMIDFDRDSSFDIVVGVPTQPRTFCPNADIACFGVYQHNGQRSPALSYGPELLLRAQLLCSPSAACPSFEYSVDHFSHSPGFSNPVPQNGVYGFSFSADLFAGSFDDGGIGEDNVRTADGKVPLMRFHCPAINRDQNFSPYPPITAAPTPLPTKRPTERPTGVPTQFPTRVPTAQPSKRPTPQPVLGTPAPTPPTASPTVFPTDRPTARPTDRPTTRPTLSPSRTPTPEPTPLPTPLPTKQPTPFPTDSPTKQPTQRPTTAPSASPTQFPTLFPSASPTRAPTRLPTASPTKMPITRAPTMQPTVFGADCCVAKQTVNCSSPAVQACVCGRDNYCCEATWDAQCVNLAIGCGGCPGLETRVPTLAPTPPPTNAPVSECERCRSIDYGLLGSDDWCRCCQLDCDNRQRTNCSLSLFCVSQFRCAGTAYCVGVQLPTLRPS